MLVDELKNYGGRRFGFLLSRGECLESRDLTTDKGRTAFMVIYLIRSLNDNQTYVFICLVRTLGE